MTREVFAEQIARLRTEWQSAYGKERMEVLYAVFHAVPDEVFRAAVDELLADHKGGAPMRREIERAVEDARLRWKARQFDGGQSGMAPVPQDTAVTPERKRRVHELVQQVVQGKVLPTATPDFAERARRRNAELERARRLSGQDKAAGEKGDD